MMTPQQLKNSILQRAIEGKLVEQRPEEGTAQELLKAIKAEKAKLVKEGKIKKSKPLPPISGDEIPFDVPESWEWVRLVDITTKLVDGDHNPPKGVSEKTEYIMASSTNINYDRLYELEKVRYLSKEVFDKENERTKATKGDIFFTSVGSIGRSCIYDGGHNICFQRSVSVVTTLIFNYYLKCVFDSPYYQNKVNQEATGTAQKGFYLKQLSNSIIPLPPLSEQKRIVAKIEELLPLVDEYDKAYSQLIALNEKFPQDMKKSILQYAIEGKLVEQRPEEGTAKELLKAIKDEKAKLVKEGKIKKSKPLPPISEEEIPFDVPESWDWVRLGDIFNMQAGKNIPATSIAQSISDKHPFLCYGGNGVRGYVSDYNRDGVYPLIGRQGALCGNVHLAEGKIYATEHAVVTELFANTNPIWAKYFLVALNLNQYATATAQPGLAVSKIENVLIPLPPLSEQKRIVGKLEELLPLCDKLAVLN